MPDSHTVSSNTVNPLLRGFFFVGGGGGGGGGGGAVFNLATMIVLLQLVHMKCII